MSDEKKNTVGSGGLPPILRQRGGISLQSTDGGGGSSKRKADFQLNKDMCDSLELLELQQQSAPHSQQAFNAGRLGYLLDYQKQQIDDVYNEINYREKYNNEQRQNIPPTTDQTSAKKEREYLLAMAKQTAQKSQALSVEIAELNQSIKDQGKNFDKMATSITELKSTAVCCSTNINQMNPLERHEYFQAQKRLTCLNLLKDIEQRQKRLFQVNGDKQRKIDVWFTSFPQKRDVFVFGSSRREVFKFGANSSPPKSAFDGHASVTQAAQSSDASNVFRFSTPIASASIGKPPAVASVGFKLGVDTHPPISRTAKRRTKKLRQRKHAKATKLSPPKTHPPKADQSNLSKRTIIKAKRSFIVSSSANPSTNSSKSTSNSPQRDKTPTPHVPSPPVPKSCARNQHDPTPPPVPESSANTPPTQTADSDDTDEVLIVKMRATLLTRVDRAWAKKAKGELHVYSNSKVRWIELKKNNECILNLLVEQMINLNKLVKQSDKGTCAYIKFSVKKRNSTESLLLQVMPERLDKLYSALLDE